jgi:hypothetical protein
MEGALEVHCEAHLGAHWGHIWRHIWGAFGVHLKARLRDGYPYPQHGSRVLPGTGKGTENLPGGYPGRTLTQSQTQHSLTEL